MPEIVGLQLGFSDQLAVFSNDVKQPPFLEMEAEIDVLIRDNFLRLLDQ